MKQEKIWPSPLPEEGNIYPYVVEAFLHNKELFSLLQNMGFLELFWKFENHQEFVTYLANSWDDLNQTQKNALLIYSWYWEVIIAGDWSIDRVEEAEKCLWLQRDGFSKMQSTLADKYGWESPVHLHKWFWDGTLMKVLSQKSWKWEQKGIADKVYFSLEEILYQFLYKPNLKDKGSFELYQKGFLWFLAAVIKKELKDLWFESEEWAAISEWKPRQVFRDINEIYNIVERLRQNPEDSSYIPQVYNEKNWEFTLSVDFESDTKKMETRSLEYLVRRFLHKKHGSALKAVKRHQEAYKDQERERLERIFQCIREKKYDEIASELMPVLQEQGVNIYEKASDNQKRKAARVLNDMTQRELDEINNDLWNFRRVTSMFTRFSRNEKVRFLWNFLNRKFLSRSEQPNLNECVTAFTENATLWKFTDISKIYKDNSCNLITATRSDSHENDRDFENDLRGNLDVLTPWWVIFTDGTRQSFSRIQRYDILQKVVWERDDVEVTVVCNMLWDPVSCMIQKKHPQGYLSVEEKYNFIGGEFQLKSLEEVLEDKKLSTDTSLRRKILQEGWKVDVFNGILPHFKKAVNNILSTQGEKWDEIMEHYTQVLLRLHGMKAKRVLNWQS